MTEDKFPLEDEDEVEFLKKRLAKYVDDSKLKEVIIEDKDRIIAQLEDALRKTEQFKPATQLQPQEDTVNSQTVRAGVGAIENLMRLEIPKLRNRGWKTVEITMRAV